MLLAGDAATAWTLVQSALASGYDPDEIYTTMLAPALRSIGDAWQEGAIDVADEHRATNVATRIVGQLSPRFNKRGRKKGTVLITAAPSDYHALAVMMVSDLIRGAHYETVDLGASVPAESAAKVAGQIPDLSATVIIAMTPDNEPEIRSMISAIRRVSAAPVILAGGAIAGTSEATALGAHGYAASVADATALFRSPTPDTPGTSSRPPT